MQKENKLKFNCNKQKFLKMLKEIEHCLKELNPNSL